MKTSGNVPERIDHLSLELWIGDEVVEVELVQSRLDVVRERVEYSRFTAVAACFQVFR